MPKRIDPRKLIETLDEFVKAKYFQKAKIDQNKMIEEMQEEEIAKFQKPVVEEVHKIVPAIEHVSNPNVLPIEANKPTPQLPHLELKTSLSLDPDKDLDLKELKHLSHKIYSFYRNTCILILSF
jgi:homoaconitase/3-isopropylmalate dehydratase large subunit